jgi:hypothetical protein
MLAGAVGAARRMASRVSQVRRLSCAPVAAGGTDKAKRNILDLSFEDMTSEMVKLGQPAYRSRQLWTYIYSKLGTSFDHMPSFPSSLKQQVSDVWRQNTRTLFQRSHSRSCNRSLS